MPISQIIAAQSAEKPPTQRPVRPFETSKPSPTPTWSHATLAAKATGWSFHVVTPCSINACSHDGVPIDMGATTLLARPSGIEAWNCKIPSTNQIVPKAQRR